MPLKDEAYIRSSMHVPTARDYPDAPRKLFKMPKSGLHDMLQGTVEMTSTFMLLSSNAFKCTLSFDSQAQKEVVEGEGKSKVSR